MSVISMKQLLEAGVHFGHQTKKWNPKMKKYIFTDRNAIHIINLEDTAKQIDKAYLFIKEKAAAGVNVLFVGTKKQASETVMQEAQRSGMFYVNSRWLGGTLTYIPGLTLPFLLRHNKSSLHLPDVLHNNRHKTEYPYALAVHEESVQSLLSPFRLLNNYK